MKIGWAIATELVRLGAADDAQPPAPRERLVEVQDGPYGREIHAGSVISLRAITSR